MSRPRKRPRLQLIGSESPEPDFELQAARKQNDQLLKARWEDIFERYGRDFTGIGDEIGIVSGQIEVDNGHLRGMQDEPDSSDDDEEYSKFSGRRMLRAMTVAPSDFSGSVSEDEDVLQSIETLAGNAMISDNDSEDEFVEEQAEDLYEPGEDDLLAQDYHQDRAGVERNARAIENMLNAREMRSSSPDSLFDGPDNSAQPDLRAQVRQILQEEKEQALERAEEEYEPAWRLPVHISTLITHNSRGTPSIRNSRRGRSEELLNSDPGDIQKHRQNYKRRKTAILAQDRMTRSESEEARRSQKAVVAERNIRTIRADSEDPLQEGFASPEQRRVERRDARQTEAGQRRHKQRPARSSPYRGLVVSDADFVDSEEDIFSPGSDSEETDSDTRERRQIRIIFERPKPPNAKFKYKSADGQSTRTVPRFSAPETETDKITHPWLVPATRAGKPVDIRSTTQRKNGNIKYSLPDMDNDPVSKKLGRNKVMKPMEMGICIYCNVNHTNKNGVGSHWDRVLTNYFVGTLEKGDPHDITFIHDVRSKVERRIRPPVTRLLDFSTMVKMHEGQQMSFEAILKSNMLFTTKSASQLEKEFGVWRPSLEERQSQHEWTDAQTEHLRTLMNESPQSSRNSITLIRIHKLVGSKAGMSYPDIGNKIADLIMENGDFTVRLPTHTSLAQELDRAESETAKEQVALKDEVGSVIDPMILQPRPLEVLSVEQGSVPDTPESLGSSLQPPTLPNTAGVPNLYQHLAKYASESNINSVQGFRPAGAPPIDMAPRL